MKVLHLDSSALAEASVSRRLSSELVGRLRALHPGLQVVYRDLAADPALHLTGAHVAAFRGAPGGEAILSADLMKGTAYMEELLAADVLVIGAPMYNLTVPTPLKAWVDRVAIAGKTFRYTATGPAGLLKNKKAFVASARGSVYPAGSSAAALEHQESYLIGLLGFLGVKDVKVVRAEGLALGPETREASVGRALREIAAIDA